MRAATKAICKPPPIRRGAPSSSAAKPPTSSPAASPSTSTNPRKSTDTSWIHPVKYVGVWWDMITGRGQWAYTDAVSTVKLGETDYSKLPASPKHSANTANVKRYIDFAAKTDSTLCSSRGGTKVGKTGSATKRTMFSTLSPPIPLQRQGTPRICQARGVKLIMHHETSSSVRNYERHLDAAYRFRSTMATMPSRAAMWATSCPAVSTTTASG